MWNLSLESEESTADRTSRIAASADRITPEWKLSIGVDFNESHGRFNLDEEDEEELAVTRRAGRSTGWWSEPDRPLVGGARGPSESSTFSNTGRDITIAPAVRGNFFPTPCTRAGNLK